jgi:hypothetical protein
MLLVLAAPNAGKCTERSSRQLPRTTLEFQ